MEKRQIQGLIERALNCNRNSYAPYSHFNVSAAALMASGRVFDGVNVENASYPCGICAERNAIGQAVSAGETKLVAIAIVGGKDHEISDYCPPCGMCRQVMREFGNPKEITVILAKSVADFKTYSLAELLPDSFGPEAL